MSPRGGRRRASGDAAADHDTASEVLAAAAALFCTVGYTATSTYAIAARAGVRQASIYHYFAGKDVILQALLLGTVQPSLDLTEALAARPEPAAARLWALCYADVVLLCDGPVNLGALYLLPEVAGEQFADFRAQHGELLRRYADLVARVDAEGSDRVRGAVRSGQEVAELTRLVFGLVESVILRRRDQLGLRAQVVAPRVADGALRLLGLGEDALVAARSQGRAVLRDLATQTVAQAIVAPAPGAPEPSGPSAQAETATPAGPGAS
ncbi:TetR/AcrR family transcriptional regulator [Cellulomonas hominis]